MAGGLIGTGRQGYVGQANAGFQQAAGLEQRRNQANRQLEQAEQQQTMSAMGTGAGIGFMAGGPVGAGIGAGIGLLGSSLF